MILRVDQSIFLASVATSASIFILCWRQIRCHLESKKPFDDLPMPNSHWLMGHLAVLQGFFRDSSHPSKNVEGALERCNEYGQLGLWGPMGVRAVVLKNAEDARTVLSAEYYRRMPVLFVIHVEKFLGVKNVGLLRGREWRLHRSAIYRSLSPSTALSDYRSSMVEVAENLVSSLKRRIMNNSSTASLSSSPSPPSSFSYETKIEALMKMLTIDIFAKTSLSTDLDCCINLEPSPIAQAFDFLLDDFSDCLSNLFSILNNWHAIPTARNRRHLKERTILRSFLAKLIQERKKECKIMMEKEDQTDNPNNNNNNLSTPKHNKNTKDLLDNLLQAHNQDVPDTKERQSLTSDQALNDTLMALLFAGYDTTSVALTCAIYCISTNPEVEKQCLDEIQQCDSSSFFFDPAKELPYCHAVLYETLRMYPPASLTSRLMQKDVTLQGGFMLPAGTRVYVPIQSIQRDEHHFPRPMEFRPDRWVKRNTTGNWEERGEQHGEEPDTTSSSSSSSNHIPAANRSAFLAFSAGGRSCPGQKFAMQEAVLALSILLRDLKFRSIPGCELINVKGLVQHPKDGMPMRIELRQK